MTLLVQKLHGVQKQLFGMSAFGLDFNKERVRLLDVFDRKSMRARTDDTEQSPFCREVRVLRYLPARESLANGVPIHELHALHTHVFVKVFICTLL